MLTRLPLLALALSSVTASPLARRQESSAASAASSAVSSAVESVTSSAASGAESATSAASSGVESATSAAESATSAASSGAESAASGASSTAAEATGTSSAAEATSTASTGNQSYPAFPCPTGFLLTYVEQNATFPVSVTNVTAGAGDWANSTLFPNVTASEGGSNPGATHTLNVGGIELQEVLVDASLNETSGAARWSWNLTNGPVESSGISISNYSAVLSIYDPDFTATNEIGNSTVALIYVNFCANQQAAGIQLVQTLVQLELSNAQAALSGGSNSTEPTSTAAGGAESTSAAASSTSAPESASSAASGAEGSATSAASGAEGSATSAASGAESSATSAASGAESSATSAAGEATSAAASAASEASSAVAPSSSA